MERIVKWIGSSLAIIPTLGLAGFVTVPANTTVGT
jgi:hypothetical protein